MNAIASIEVIIDQWVEAGELPPELGELLDTRGVVDAVRVLTESCVSVSWSEIRKNIAKITQQDEQED